MKKHLLLLSFVITLGTAHAQNDSINIDDYYIDYTVPDLSALGMLGIKNDEIVRPGNMKEFAAALANFVDRDGSLKPALAVEWSFMRTFDKKSPIKWDKPFQSRNIAITLATTEQDSLGLRLGAGLKFSPIDKSDPLGDELFYKRIATFASAFYKRTDVRRRENFDFITVMEKLNFPSFPSMSQQQRDIYAVVVAVLDTRTKALDSLRKEIENGTLVDFDSAMNATMLKRLADKQIPVGAVPEQARQDLVTEYKQIVLESFSSDYLSFKDYISRVIKEQKEIYKKQHWNELAWQLSAGFVAHSLTSSYDDIQGEKFSMFTGLSFPTWNDPKKKRKGQLIAQLKYNMDLSGDSIDYNEFSAGFRHLYGTADNRFSVELLYSNYETEILDTSEKFPVSYLRYTVGAELKVMEGTWIEFAFGGQKFFEGQNERNAILTDFGFKHAIRNKRRYDD